MKDEISMDKEKVAKHVRSPAVLNRLVKMLPIEDEHLFSMTLPSKCDAKILEGDLPFSMLVDFVSRNINTAARGIERALNQSNYGYNDDETDENAESRFMQEEEAQSFHCMDEDYSSVLSNEQFYDIYPNSDMEGDLDDYF